MTDWTFTPLLSTKPLNSFTPTEYKEYVRSLYFKKAVKKPKKVIKIKPPFLARLNKKGTLVLKVNREPKWLSREEIDSIAQTHGKPLAEVWNKVTKAKIKVSTLEVETQLRDETTSTKTT